MTKNYIKEIEIERPAFLGDGSWKLSKLKPINILFGKNGSGKSQLLRRMREKEQRYFYASPERSGEFSFDVNIMNSQMSDRGLTKSRKTNMAQSYRQEVIGRIQVMFMTIGEISSRRNDVPDINEAENLLNTLLPEFSFKMLAKSPPYEMTRLSDGSSVTSTKDLSSGEAELLALGLDLLTTAVIWETQNEAERIFLIDEPDTHLHPDLQVILAQFFVNLAEKYQCQLIITTHSTTLLSALGFTSRKDVGVLFFQNTNAIQSFKPFDDVLATISSCLGGHALMGPVFGATMILVEGDDDYRIWTHISRGEAIKMPLAVLPCQGDHIKKHQEALEGLFASICSKDTFSGYALLDGDKSLPTHGQNNHIKYLRLECRESENLFLTDEILGELGFNWEQAQAKIRLEAKDYNNKFELLLKATESDRKNDDFKEVINEISNILDSKKVFWPVRVGKYLGKNTPSGQLKEFLGSQVCHAFWRQVHETPYLSKNET